MLGRSDDVIALTEVTHKYAQAIDEQDWDLFRTLFTDDCVIDYGFSPVVGCEAFLRVAQGTCEVLDATHHVFTNHLFDVDGDRASGRFSMTAQHVRRGAEGGSLYTLGGTYWDDFVRGADGWRISKRVYRATWGRGNAALLGGRFVCDDPRA